MYENVHVANKFKFFMEMKKFDYVKTKRWLKENKLSMQSDFFVFYSDKGMHVICMNDETYMVDYKLRFA